MRIGIIGLGRAGSVHSAACRSIPGVELAAICDPLPAARETARQAGIASYADVSNMLDTECLDAVTICVPPADHAAVAIACLDRGLHVLCEKPLAPRTWDVLQMFAAAQRNQRLLLVASKFRHIPAVNMVREMLLAGEFGEPVSFGVTFCSPVPMAERWNAQQHIAGGGVIADNGCHAFDVATYLFGPIERVHATRLKTLQRLTVEDSASLRVATAAGTIGTVDVSWSLDPARDAYLVLCGSRGTAEIGWHGTRLNCNGQGWHEVADVYDKVDTHRRMHTAFRDAVWCGREPWITMAECVQNVAAVEAAYESLRSGTWHTVRPRAHDVRGQSPLRRSRRIASALRPLAISHPDAA